MLDFLRWPRYAWSMAAVCAMCGRIADGKVDGDPPLGWCADLVEGADGQYIKWICAACTRRYVRSIEAKLDAEWWE